MPSEPSEKYLSMKKGMFLLTIITTILVSCSHKQKTSPKPFGYIRIDFPQHRYKLFDSASFPYAFEYPIYAKIEKDNDVNTEPFWINIYFPKFMARIHLTYHKINNNLDTLLDDSHILVYKHTVKADNITAKDYTNDSMHVYATLFTLEGNAATPFQFHIMDSTKNFVRGSLYFHVRPRYDSLYPYISFIGEDIKHLIETFRWK